MDIVWYTVKPQLDRYLHLCCDWLLGESKGMVCSSGLAPLVLELSLLLIGWFDPSDFIKQNSLLLNEWPLYEGAGLEYGQYLYLCFSPFFFPPFLWFYCTKRFENYRCISCYSMAMHTTMFLNGRKLWLLFVSLTKENDWLLEMSCKKRATLSCRIYVSDVRHSFMQGLVKTKIWLASFFTLKVIKKKIRYKC